MRARIHVGTDLAMIGAWDESRCNSPISKDTSLPFDQIIGQDAASGDVFVIKTGADCGGIIEVYVNEKPSSESLRSIKPAGRDLLLSVPTGRLVVAGMEDYRSDTPKFSDEKSIVTIPSGDYRLRCYVGHEDAIDSQSEEELKATVGVENLRSYERFTGRGSLAGCLLPFLMFPVATYVLGWKLAILAAIAAFYIYTFVFNWVLKRNPKYRELEKVVPKFRQERQPLLFILELEKLSGPTSLKGGVFRP